MKTTKKRILSGLLALIMILTLLPGMAFALPDEEAMPEPCCYDCVQDGYTVDDILQTLNDDEKAYHDVIISEDEPEFFIDIEYGDAQPFQNENNDFRYYRIRCSGRPLEDSIVVMLLSDGFAREQFGTWDIYNPDPGLGTALWHADQAINTMLGRHPFSLFADRFIVYMIHDIPYDQEPGVNGYFGTVTATGGLTPMGVANANRVNTHISTSAHGVTHTIGHQDMVHVISNASGGPVGYAWISSGMGIQYNHHRNVAVTSIRRPAGPSSNLSTYSEWHEMLLHEFGHSFGTLLDELLGIPASDLDRLHGDRRANTSRLSSDTEVKWQHWVGYRNVSIVPRDGDWVVPAGSNCIMGDGLRVDGEFCGVCSAELIRRMAYITGEPFHGRSPVTNRVELESAFITSTNYPWVHTSYIPIAQGTTRILDSAFHGNRAVQSVSIPTSVRTIGDYAFIGATGLRVIYNHNITPQQINDTTFTGVTRSNVTVYIPIGTTQAYRNAGWTNFRLVETPSIKFEFYGIDSMNYVRVLAPRGQNVNITSVNLVMEALEYFDDVRMDRFAHLGWFTDESLNASGRRSTERNVREGLRRPVVGTTGFDVDQVITQEVLDRYARGGVIHLHSVWSLWGDVNDDDRVDSDDLRALTWHVGQLEPRPIMNLAAADVHRNGTVNSDDLRELTWYVGQLSPRPVLGASPATNLANALIDDSSRLINDEAIWHISHEVITPDAEYVDIRVYLYQNPTNSTNPHGGMDVTVIRFEYDSDVLSNPRQTPAMNFFDFSLLTEAERMDFDAMVAAFAGFPFFMTYEAARDAAKGQSMFAHAWVRPPVANHEGFRFTMHYSYEYFSSGGHGLGPHILQLNWSPEAGHNPKGYPFVYVRFDVTPDMPVGTVTPLTFLAEQDMSGGIQVVTNAGSVTIVAE